MPTERDLYEETGPQAPVSEQSTRARSDHHANSGLDIAKSSLNPYLSTRRSTAKAVVSY